MSDWTDVTLGEICSPKQWHTIGKEDFSKTGYSVYGANGIIGLYKTYNHAEPVIAVTCRGATCGSISITKPFSYVTGNSMCLDEIRRDVDTTFLFHFLLFSGFKDAISGSAQPQITRGDISKTNIVLPPLPEQKKIAEILSGIDNLIKMIDIKILKLKIAIAEVFRDVFSDFSPTEEEAVFPQDISKSIKTLPLESVCEAVVDCKNRTPPYVDQGYPVIRTPNVRNGRLVIADLRYTDEESYQIWTARSVPRPMDILFTREAPLGEACLIPNGFRCCLGQRMMLFRANKSLLDPQYLLYAMMSTFVQEQLGKSKGGTTVGHARVADIRKIKIPILPMEKQLQIAFLLASINSCLQQTIEKKKKMQVKKNALASDLLSGRKRVST